MNMPSRLQLVGDLERQDHYHLPADAQCYFWGEYTPYEHTNGQKWNYSPTNQLIANFKKKMDRRGFADWPHKVNAIQRVARQFAVSWKWADISTQVALIPIPPSKSRDDPNFDPRMTVMLEQLASIVNLPLDIRDCLSFSGKHAASHETVNRPTPDELYEELRFEDRSTRQRPAAILVFDDMLTTGAHYVAVTRKLAMEFPGVPVLGQFVARRVVPDPFADFDVEDAI